MNNNLGIVLPMGQNRKRLMEGGQWSLWENELTEYKKFFDHVELFEYRHCDWRRFFEALLLTVTESDRLKRCSVFKAVHLTGSIPCFMTKLLYGIPYVLSFGYRYDEFARVEKKWLQWIFAIILTPSACRMASVVMVPTEAIEKFVKKNGAKRVVVIPNGVDTKLFRPALKAALKSPTLTLQSRTLIKPKSILFVGRFEPQKNLISLIKAVRLFQQRSTIASKFRKTVRDSVPFFGKIVVTFIGRGRQKTSLEHMVQSLRVSAKIVSPIPNDRLVSFYQQADIFVLPSLVEGFPKALLEAMSCGLPVVASKIPGCADIVTDGYDGLLVEPTANELQRGLSRIFGDQKFAKCLGQHARQTIMSKFDKKKLMEKEIKVLHKTIGDR